MVARLFQPSAKSGFRLMISVNVAIAAFASPRVICSTPTWKSASTCGSPERLQTCHIAPSATARTPSSSSRNAWRRTGASAMVPSAPSVAAAARRVSASPFRMFSRACSRVTGAAD